MTPANHMSLIGCVVKYQIPGMKEEFSNCGTFLLPLQGLILSHGSLLTELCSQDNELKTKINNGQFIDNNCLESCRFSVLLDKRWYDKTSHQIEMYATSNKQNSPHQETPSYVRVKCQFLGAFRNSYFHETVASLMPESNWKITDGTSDTSVEKSNKDLSNTQIESDSIFQLMSYFLILKIDPETLYFDENVKSVESLLSRRDAVLSGDVAELISTPFGGLSPGVFFNSFSQGVISNVSGPDNCWILTDARCIPGSEGAPLFSRSKGDRDRFLTGVVAASLCWKNNEWVGFSVACSLCSIWHSLAQKPWMNAVLQDGALAINDKLSSEKLNKLEVLDFKENWLLAATVLVQVGSTWGSGVIIDKDEGLILTCSHVVKDAAVHSVMVSSSLDPQQYKSVVVYRQDPLTGPLDVALLRCHKVVVKASRHFISRVGRPVVGDQVYAVGHAVFGRNCNLKPSVSAGVISKVISSGSYPVMVQSTCAVHPGASGGPLLSQTGHLVGVLVCNTKDQGTSTSYPHVNMSVPTITVFRALQQYALTKEENFLNKLQLHGQYVKDLWNLGNGTNDSITGPSRL